MQRSRIPRVLTEDELDALLEAAPSERYRAMWAILRWTAGRIGEVLDLRWRDLDSGVMFHVSSSGRGNTRRVPMVAPLIQEVAAYRTAWTEEHGHEPQPDEALFPGAGSSHSPQSRQAADKALRQCCERLGLKGVSSHSFRRTLAVTALRRGASLTTIQRITGHRSMESLAATLVTDDALALLAEIED